MGSRPVGFSAQDARVVSAPGLEGRGAAGLRVEGRGGPEGPKFGFVMG